MGVVANSNVSSKKCVKIIAFNLNQLQVTTIHAQANVMIQQVYCRKHPADINPILAISDIP
jgi:hypothetical protein